MKTTAVVAAAVLAATVTAVPASAQQAAWGERKDIVEVARDAGTFGTLLAAATAAGLVDVLKGEGPLTVFAPTDEAFAKLPAGTVDALLKDPAKLGEILKYHVVPGRVMSADVVRAGRAQPATAQGGRLNVRVENGRVRVNDATVTAADIAASNGVIHVIDTVILPPAGE